MKFRVTVWPKEVPEEPLDFSGITGIALIDQNSHGPAALGDLAALEVGNKRLLICSTNTTAATIEKTGNR